MTKPKYKLTVKADVVGVKQYEIDWDMIKQQVQEAALLVNKEPEMKKKNGKKKKGY